MNTTASSNPLEPTFDATKQTVSGQLNTMFASDSPLMKRAETKGLQHANTRGLLNSSLAANSAQTAMIDAATPIANADANAYQQDYMTKLQTSEGVKKMGYEASANTQGKYLESLDKITNNAMVSINEIETATDISQANKDKMIANTTARRDADLAWTRQLYSNMPTWDFNWFKASSSPSAPGKA